MKNKLSKKTNKNDLFKEIEKLKKEVNALKISNKTKSNVPKKLNKDAIKPQTENPISDIPEKEEKTPIEKPLSIEIKPTEPKANTKNEEPIPQKTGAKENPNGDNQTKPDKKYVYKIKAPQNTIGIITGLVVLIIIVIIIAENIPYITDLIFGLNNYTSNAPINTSNPTNIQTSPTNSQPPQQNPAPINNHPNATVSVPPIVNVPTFPNRVNLYLSSRYSPQPTGIVSYGLYNSSGYVQPYTIETNEVAGIAQLSSISAYNSTPPINISQSDASLQLNAVLVIQNYNGSKIVLWPQNIVNFNTQNDYLAYHGSFTLLSAGNVEFTYPPNEYCQESSYMQQQYFNCVSTEQNYNLPMTFMLSMNASIIPNQGVLLDYNFLNINNIQTQSGGGFTWSYTESPPFESVTFQDPNAEYTYFMTSGYNYTPSYPYSEYYDTEFVFGGGGNGEQTYFDSLNADIALMYYNNSVESFEDFPSLYTFGGDTAEGADNLYVSGLSNNWANAYITTGTPNYIYLGSN